MICDASFSKIPFSSVLHERLGVIDYQEGERPTKSTTVARWTLSVAHTRPVKLVNALDSVLQLSDVASVAL
jgi:hypothetical protein